MNLTAWPKILTIYSHFPLEHVDQLEWIKSRLNGAADDRAEDGIKPVHFFIVRFIKYQSFNLDIYRFGLRTFEFGVYSILIHKNLKI